MPARAEAARAPLCIDRQHVGVFGQHPARRRGRGRAQHHLQPRLAQRVDGAVEPVPVIAARPPAPSGSRRTRRSAPRSGQARPCGRVLGPLRFGPMFGVIADAQRAFHSQDHLMFALSRADARGRQRSCRPRFGVRGSAAVSMPSSAEVHEERRQVRAAEGRAGGCAARRLDDVAAERCRRAHRPPHATRPPLRQPQLPAASTTAPSGFSPSGRRSSIDLRLADRPALGIQRHAHHLPGDGVGEMRGSPSGVKQIELGMLMPGIKLAQFARGNSDRSRRRPVRPSCPSCRSRTRPADRRGHHSSGSSGLSASSRQAVHARRSRGRSGTGRSPTRSAARRR